MTLENLDGIANVSYDISDTLTWETASDWDSAATDSGVAHADIGDYAGSGSVQLGYSATDTDIFHLAVFDESSGPIQDYSGNGISGSLQSGTLGQTGLHNTTALGLDGTDDEVNFGTPSPYSASNLGSAFSFVVVITPSSGAFDGGRYDLFGRTGGGNDNFVVGADSGGWGLYLDTGDGTAPRIDIGTPSAGNRYLIALTYDGSAARFYENGSEIYSDTAHNGDIVSSPNNLKISNDTSYTGRFPGKIDLIQSYYRTLSASEVQTLYDAFTTGSLTTATKSFSTNTAPDLQNLSYSLNGESITLDVIGSPGTASEEIISQTLDGADAYTLSWSDTHTDFRLGPNFSSTSETSSPVFGRGELVE